MKKILFLIISFGLLAGIAADDSFDAGKENVNQADEGPLFWTPVRLGVGKGCSLPDASNVCPLNFNMVELDDFNKLPNIFGLSIGGITSGRSLYGIASGIAVGGDYLNGLGAGALASFGNNMNGLQIGGLFTAFSQDSNGLALGGMMAETKGDVNGMIFGGGAVLALQEMNGFALGGFFLRGKDLNGLSFASGVLFSEKNNGIAIGGLYNAVGQSDGIQVGLLNFLREPMALELSPVIARTANLPSRACQFGLVNWTKELAKSNSRNESGQPTGTQAAKGKDHEFVIQFGLINVNREGDGLQFGLLNFSRKGFLKCFPIVNFKL